MIAELYRDKPERWHIVVGDFDGLPFDNFSTWLQPLNISGSNATAYFIKDYWDAWCPFTSSWILGIFHEVALANKKKYDKLIAVYQAQYDPISNYDRTEEIEEVRTPDLTRASESEASSTTEASGTLDAQRKQTRTLTENGGTFSDESIRAVQPFDAATFTNAEKNTTTYSGSRTNTEAFSGDPDHQATSSESTIGATEQKTETETGTDTRERTAHIYGNIGVTTSQQMLESEMQLADKMNIWKVIERDLAKALFLGTW